MYPMLFNQPVFTELDMVFPTYFFKFSSCQGFLQPAPLTQLYFQRFVRMSEYISLPYLNLAERFFAQLEIPEVSTQNDYQKLLFTTLHGNPSDTDHFLAETIDENAEFIYLIIDNSFNPSMSRVFSSYTLEVYRFSFQELWQVTDNALNYIRAIQINTSFSEKQYLQHSAFFEIFKQSSEAIQLRAQSKEQRMEVNIEDARKRAVKKANCEVDVKLEIMAVECLLCCNNPKDVVFLPCGHLVACKNCTTEQLDIELGKPINQRRTPRNCPVCIQPIKEAKEVFIQN